LNFTRRSKGQYLPLASPEEATRYPYAPIDRARIRANRARVFVGTARTVYERLMPLVEQTQADEVMITTMIYDHGARCHSYELLAEVFNLRQRHD
jgi:alkanesulfonate monooxygenase SsuD/methylene tetrahydromethanopterin reductase-like flavin-dependent oxidoreductase (luciferase family)